MPESATTETRRGTAARITRCARDLAEARGVDGFTMDEVAACAGVSRRTLFNHVAGKFDAILGAPVDPDPAGLIVFRRGGPSGRLLDDLTTTVTTALDRKDCDPDETDRIRGLIASDARLHKALHDRFAALAEILAIAIVEREGEAFGTFRAGAIAAVTLSMFDVAIRAFIADPTTTLAEHYGRAVDAVVLLVDDRRRDVAGPEPPPGPA